MHIPLHITTALCLQLENPGWQSEWFGNLQKDDIPPLRLIYVCILLKGCTQWKNECASYINTVRISSPPSL